MGSEMTEIDSFPPNFDSSDVNAPEPGHTGFAPSDLAKLLVYLSGLPESCWTVQEAQEYRKGQIIAAFAHQIVGMADVHNLGPLKGVAIRLGQAARSEDWNRVRVCLEGLRDVARIYLEATPPSSPR